MRSGAWVALSGGGAVVAGVALLLWARNRNQECLVRVAEKGSQNPFECVSAGLTPFVAGIILTPLGLVALTGGGLALMLSK